MRLIAAVMLGRSLSSVLPPALCFYLFSSPVMSFCNAIYGADVTHGQQDPAGICLLVGGSREGLLKGGFGGRKQQIRQVLFLLCFKDKARALRKQISQINLVRISLLQGAATEIQNIGGCTHPPSLYYFYRQLS